MKRKAMLTRAATQYVTVLSIDPEAAEAWIRLGTIYCLSNPKQSSKSWQKAEQLEPESPQLWLERARCELKHNQPDLALRFAQLTIRFEPSSAEAASLIAIISANLNEPRDGLKWLLGAAAMNPTNVYLWQAIFILKNTPIPERRYAARQLARMRPLTESAIPPLYSTSTDSNQPIRAAWNLQLVREFESALRKNDTPETRRLATLLGINPQQLARRALIEGAYGVVLNEVELILALDSNNISAWIMGLLAADRSRDDVRFSAILSRVPESTMSADDTLQNLLIELVRWRAAVEAQNLRSPGTFSHSVEQFPLRKPSAASAGMPGRPEAL